MDGFGRDVPGQVSEHWKETEHWKGTEKGWPAVQVLAIATVLESLSLGGEVAGELVEPGVGPTLPACTGALTSFVIDASCTTLRRLRPLITILMRFLDLTPVPRINVWIVATLGVCSLFK